jgi:hypothetical protein
VELFPVMSYDTPYNFELDEAEDVAVIVDALPTGE